MFPTTNFANIEFEDIYIFTLTFTFLLVSFIAIMYYFRSYYLMSAIGVSSWSDISDHYSSIKKLKIAGWS